MTPAFTNDPALFEWCENLIAKKKFEDAEKFAHVLYETRDHPSRLMLARALDANGKGKQATKLLKTHITDKMGTVGPEMFEAAHLNGKILASLGKLKAAEKNLKHALRVLPQDKVFDTARASAEYQLASLLSALGKFHPAQEIFNKSMPVNCDNNWKTSARIVDFFVGTKSKETPKSHTSNPPELPFEPDISPDTKLVYFVSGDLAYCSKFGPSLVDHLKIHSSQKVHLHIHGISIGDNDRGAKALSWNKLKESLNAGDLSLSITNRHLDINHLTPAQMKSIYSFERFWLLPSVLETYNKPVLVADLDQIPLRDPSALLSEEFDVALLKFPKSVLNILSVISATLSIFRPSSEGHRLAKELSEYFTSAFNNEAKLNWHVDQAGLAVLDYKNTEGNIFYLDPKLVVTDPSKHDPLEAAKKGAWFWSVTNSIAGNEKRLETYNKKTGTE